MAHEPTPIEKRITEIERTLEERHPETEPLIGELSDLCCDWMAECEERAIEHQGKVILAAVTGKLPRLVHNWDLGVSEMELSEMLS